MLVHQHGKGSPASRPVDPLECGTRGRTDEQWPHRRVGERGVEHQPADGGGHRHLGQHQDLPAVHRVGQRPAPEGAREEREELGETDQADDQGGVGEPEGLKGNGDQGQLRADPRKHLAGPQTAEVPVLAERRDVDQESGHWSTVVGVT